MQDLTLTPASGLLTKEKLDTATIEAQALEPEWTRETCPYAGRERLLATAAALSSRHETPFLALDCELAVSNWQRIRDSIPLPNVNVLYSVKANPHPELLDALAQIGSGFDVASFGELALLLKLGIDLHRVIFSAPVKLPWDVRQAFQYGVRRYVYDSETEAQKLAALAPGSQVLLRLAVSNEGSRWPLVKKFGVPPYEAVDLLLLARRLGLECVGLTFHVGSQCESPTTWDTAIAACRSVWRAAEAVGLNLSVLDIGGGFPARYTSPVPSIEALGSRISRLLQLFPPHTRLVVEPGRAVVADAGILAATVIGRRPRDGRVWLYLDVGVYNGLFEAIEGWQYQIVSTRDGPRSQFVLAGPTCDSTDIISYEACLPDLQVGDKVFIITAGAYTTAYERYNGLQFPSVCRVRHDCGMWPPCDRVTNGLQGRQLLPTKEVADDNASRTARLQVPPGSGSIPDRRGKSARI